MSTDKPAKKPRSTKTKADLEAKIAELEAKLNTLAAQASKPAETKPAPQVQQRPPPPPSAAKPTVPKPEVAQTSTQEAEVAPAYTTSSSSYTGNRYFATRKRMAYHPPDKQFTGQVTVQVSRPEPEPVPEPEPERAEPEPQKQKEEPRRIEPPALTVKYTGVNYYKTRRRLAYHPPDKQFIETVAVKFEEAPTAAQVEYTTSSQSTSSSQKRSRDEQLAEYEREYLERVQQRKAEAEKPAPAPTKPRGTMPAGWKPS